MPTLTLFQGQPTYNFNSILQNVLGGGAVDDGSSSSTSLVIVSGIYSLVVTGSGFTWDSGRSLTGGTITGFDLYQDTTTQIATATGYSENVSDLQAVFTAIDSSADQATINAALQAAFVPSSMTVNGSSDGDYYLPGSESGDTIYGNGGQDTIYGNGGDDTIYGGSESDFINPGAGNDTVDGGSGGSDDYDNIIYDDATAGITVNKTDRLSGTVTGSTVGTDTFTNIEIVVGTDYADTFNGSSQDDDFTGNGGADTFNGGDGNDQVVYQKEQYGPNGGSSHGIIVNLSGSDATGVSADGISSTTVLAHTAIDSFGSVDQLNSIEKIVGTDQNDTLIGDDGYNHLEGLSGDDTLIGNGGHDELLGGAGNDMINGGDDNDFINPGSGNDTIVGGDGGNNYDTLAYFQVGWGGDTAITQGASFDVASGTATDAWGYTDIFSGIEEFLGTGFADTFTGDNSGSTFVGMAGNDSFTGGADDRVDYSHETEFDGGTHGVIVNLSGSTLTSVSVTGIPTTDVAAHTAIDAFNDTDSITGIGTITGTNFDDMIVGDDGYNSFNGGRGNDTITGGSGYDDLGYYQYSDTSAPTQGINVDVASGTATDAWGDTDTFSSIEEFQGTGFADTFTGNNSGSTFIGLAGNDSFTGGANDRIAYHGADFNGGTHGVIVNLSGSTLTGVSVTGIPTTDVAAHTAIDAFNDTDSITGIGRIVGTQFDDIIIGSDSADNVLVGLGGDDSINGGGGNDNINPGDGTDTIDGGAGNDTIDYYQYDVPLLHGIEVTWTSATSGTIIDPWGSTDTFTNVEQVNGTDLGDTVTASDAGQFIAGGAGADSLTGGAGNDYFTGFAGNDTIDGGGSENNGVEYENENGGAGVTVNLETGTATDTYGDTDTLSHINEVTGTNQADTLIGTDNPGNTWYDNGITGLGGADTIDGQGGFDIAYYDRDAENGGTNGINANMVAGTVVDGFGDTDTISNIEGIRGTQYADTMLGDAGDVNYFQGLAGNDTIDGGGGYDIVDYSKDAEHGGSAGVTVNLDSVSHLGVAAGQATDGFGDTDTLSNIEAIRGTDQADTIYAGSNGLDFQGLAGNDTLVGGVGIDTANYANDAGYGGTGGVTVDLGAGTATDGFGSTDTLSGIENITGTGFADMLTGDSGANTINAGDGDDTLVGGDGNDTLNGGTGTNTIDGGVGRDIAVFDFASSDASITHNPNGTWTISYGGTVDTLTGVEVARFTDKDVGLGTVRNDFNGDNRSDILWRNNVNGAVIELDMNDRTVLSSGSVGGNLNWSVVGVGDFNGDNRSDILWRNNVNGAVIESDMNDRTVLSSGSVGGNLNWSVVGVGDFNNDGNSDILWRNNVNGSVIELDMNDRTVLSSGSVGGNLNWSVVGVGDFNNDGNSDILWRNNVNGSVIELDMNDRTVLSSGSVGGNLNWSVVGVGDFNGDGNSDILWRSNVNGAVVELDMNDRTVLSSGGIGGNLNWSVVQVGDYNGDGNSDILWRNNVNGAVVELDMNDRTVLSSGGVGGSLSWLAMSV